MSSRLHEDMTRTHSPSRTGPPLRAAALITLCAATLLILGWAVFSPLGGTGEHQAQAQTPEPEEGSGGTSGEGEDEPSYEAFGEQKNPFARVVQAKTEDSGNGEQDGSGDTGNGGNAANGEGSNFQPQSTDDEMTDVDPSAPGDDNGSLNDNGNNDDSPQGTTSVPPPNGGSAAGSGAGDVNCQNPADDFEELLCEEGAGGSTDDRTGSVPPGGIDDDLGGGSGRSGAGETTDTFRNGGPAPTK